MAGAVEKPGRSHAATAKLRPLSGACTIWKARFATPVRVMEPASSATDQDTGLGRGAGAQAFDRDDCRRRRRGLHRLEALDRLFGTAPILMVVFLILGAAAGILNVIRSAQRRQAQAGPLPGNDLPRGRRRRLGAMRHWLLSRQDSSMWSTRRKAGRRAAQPDAPIRDRPLPADQALRLRRLFTNSALFMVIAAGLITAIPPLRDALGRARAVPAAVDGRVILRVRCQHGARQCRQGGHEVFPFVFTLFMFILTRTCSA